MGNEIETDIVNKSIEKIKTTGFLVIDLTDIKITVKYLHYFIIMFLFYNNVFIFILFYSNF